MSDDDNIDYNHLNSIIKNLPLHFSLAVRSMEKENPW